MKNPIATVYAQVVPSHRYFLTSVVIEGSEEVQCFALDTPAENWTKIVDTLISLAAVTGCTGLDILVHASNGVLDTPELEKSGIAYLDTSISSTVMFDEHMSESIQHLREKQLQNLPVYQVGTDASAIRAPKVARIDGKPTHKSFYGVIYDDGTNPSTFLYGQSKSPRVNVAEMTAIAEAFQGMQNATLHVLSDSRECVNLINGIHTPKGEMVSLVRKIRMFMVTTGSTVTWVKGHDTSAINDAADRIAVAARRHFYEDIPSDKTEVIMNNICRGYDEVRQNH